MHAGRVLCLCVIVGLLHMQHVKRESRRRAAAVEPVSIERIRILIPDADHTGGESAGRTELLNARNDVIGYALQTSPDSDHVLGFSGPTNVLLVFDRDLRLLGADILSSRDTREHVERILQDRNFLRSFHGLSWSEMRDRTDFDAVSGATLTSLAIAEAVVHRLGGGVPSLRFPDPVRMVDVRLLFPDAADIDQDPDDPAVDVVRSVDANAMGTILRTSPAADNIVGYQGPTQALVGLNPSGTVIGLVIAGSYDNEPYVGYVRDDDYFRSILNERTLDDLAAIDPEAEGIEGVSGATMTSVAVARGIGVAARARQAQRERKRDQASRGRMRIAPRDMGTCAVILLAMIVGFTHLRGNRWVRIGFQCLLVVYLGLINGDMISQAMLVGWARNGIPWANATGLVLLTVAAFTAPVVSRSNLYCSHVCPHGAVQQLLLNRLPWRARLSRPTTRVLSLLPAGLLLWVISVAMLSLDYSLVDIEPFDAWVFRIAGGATISVAVIGLVASAFVPMAYCRFGCPTGAILGYLRYNRRSSRYDSRDLVALSCLTLAIILFVIER